ncbi:MAG: TrkA family potassium uptake protein [Syntrophomonadaceae bacterium]|nr:TrkA family potassium uptake protein [Syntrophomonadaceae bacterium]
MRKKQFAVIGIGRFGESLISELVRLGHEVLAIDTDENRVDDIASIATQAVQADAMDEKVLKALDIVNFDAVVVAIGGDVEANILTSITLKEIGVKKIIAKAHNTMHGKVLEKMGINMVLYPERDMAIRLARNLVSTSIIEYIELSSDHGISERTAPLNFVGKSLEEKALRQRMDITILAVRSGSEIIVSPQADYRIKAGDIIVALGPVKQLEKLHEMD